jgi:hypothetical protein
MPGPGCPGYLGRTRSCARGTTTNVHRVGRLCRVVARVDAVLAQGRPQLVQLGVHPGQRQGQMGSNPDGWIRIEVPRGQLEDVIRAVRRAARDTDAEYQALPARREWARREAQAQHERLADPAKRARLAEDQARIDAVLAETD